MKAYGKAPILNRIGRLAAALLAVWCFMGFARADAAIDSWSALQATIDRAGAGEVIALTEDLTALEGDVTLTVPAGKRLVLDLNGYTLDRNRKVRDQNSGSVITIEAGAVLTLRDSVGTGVITGGSHDNGGGILNRGTLIMEGGRITGNAALIDGKIAAGNAAFTTIVIDVNFHKRVNDTYGHEKGNAYLVVNSRAIAQAFGEENAYRIGGRARAGKVSAPQTVRTH